MLTYKIVHHLPGRIRIEVPAIKNKSIAELMSIFSSISIPEGIKNIRPNPYTGSVLIIYDPARINIIEYIKTITSSTEIQKLMGEQD